MVAQVARLLEAPAEAFDLLNVVDLKDGAVAVVVGLCLEQEGDEDGPVGVGVDAAAGVAAGEGGEEEGRALGGLVDGRGAEVGPLELLVAVGRVLGLEGEDVDVGGLHEFLLDA